MIELLLEILRPLYTSPVFVSACCISMAGPVWILVFYAGLTRIKKARAENDHNQVRSQQLLIFFSPLLLLTAALLAAVALFMPVFLVAVLIGLLPLIVLFFVISLAIEYGPDIKEWILATLGKFGEKMLKFIENSPRFPLLKLDEIRSWLATRVEIYFSRHPANRTLSPRSSALPFELLGLKREAILRTGASNSEVKLPKRLKAISRLVRMKAYDQLLDLASERAVDIEVRVHAAQALEGIENNIRAIQAWLDLGRTAPHPIRRLDAAHRLACLEQPDHARSILKRLLAQGELPGKFQIEAVKTLGQLGEAAQAAKTLTDMMPNRGERYLRLRCADALCALEHTKEAVPILQALAFDFLTPQLRRQAAIYVLDKYGQAGALIELAGHPQVDHALRCRILRSLERLDKTAFAARSWEHMSKDENAPFEQRIQAAAAYGRLEKPEAARLILRELGRDTQAQSEMGLKIAAALAKLNFREDARLILDQLINAPGLPEALKKDATQALNDLHAGKFPRA